MFIKLFTNLRVFYTNLTTTNSSPQSTSFQGLFLRPLELLSVLYRCHPEAEFVRIIMAVSFGAVALDERRSTEIFETRARTR